MSRTVRFSATLLDADGTPRTLTVRARVEPCDDHGLGLEDEDTPQAPHVYPVSSYDGTLLVCLGPKP